MPVPTRTLTERTARTLIGEWSFPATSKGRVGIELEWFTTPSSSPPDVDHLQRLLEPVGPLPGGSAITFEPGGQVELSSVPFEAVGEACRAIAGDTDVVRRALSRHGVDLFAGGLDPERSLDLRTSEPRYTAMRRYYDAYGIAAGRMMCASAAVHVNLDAGDDEEGHHRWRAAHAIGPVLIAAFANSPIVDHRPSGWKSSRLQAWSRLDPARGRPVGTGAEPSAAWADYALAAPVMFIRSEGGFRPLDRPMTLAEWLEDGHRLGYPDEDDLSYHLTTLFPPIRPRGYLEIRMIDMLPDPWWRVAVAVTTALVDDREARQVAASACSDLSGMWTEAARSGLSEPALGRAAKVCFDAALEALVRTEPDDDIATATRSYIDRFVEPARCPADDQLDHAPDVEPLRTT